MIAECIRKCLVLLPALGLVAGCGGTDSVLIMTVDDDTLPADGSSSTTLTVRPVFRGDPADGRVNITASAGGFDDRGNLETRVSTTGGEGRVEWFAPYERDGEVFVGDVNFTASYSDPYGVEQTARAVVSIVEPPPIDGNSFDFWCSANNIQRPAAGDDPVEIPCYVEARDVRGRDIEIDDVRFGFMAETGRFEIEDGEVTWILSPGQRPRQVEPLGDSAMGEPRWFDQQAGVTRNPRDGIATLVVHTRGSPTAQQDFMQGEPYVDEDDSGQWEPGEPFYDDNDNGQYDGPTGSTEDRRIWRWAKIMITGPLSERAPDAAEGLSLWDTGEHPRQNIPIHRGEEISIGVLLVDENLNPIASHSASDDAVRVEGSPNQAEISPRDQQLRQNAMGLTFQPDTGQVVAGTGRSGYLQGDLTYWFRIENDRSDDDEDPLGFSLDEVRVRRIPYPGGSRVTEFLDGQSLPRGQLY